MGMVFLWRLVALDAKIKGNGPRVDSDPSGLGRAGTEQTCAIVRWYACSHAQLFPLFL